MANVFAYVRSTARHTLHLQFNVSAKALEIRAVQNPKCIVGCAVDRTLWRSH
jgi:hypothetical protein